MGNSVTSMHKWRYRYRPERSDDTTEPSQIDSDTSSQPHQTERRSRRKPTPYPNSIADAIRAEMDADTSAFVFAPTEDVISIAELPEFSDPNVEKTLGASEAPADAPSEPAADAAPEEEPAPEADAAPE
jgi:hypothetical protein